MSFTPDQIEALRAQLNGADPGAVAGPSTGLAPMAPDRGPPPAELSFYDRLQSSGQRLAQNPAIQSVGGLPVAIATEGLGAGAPRDTTSFTRERPPGPDPVQLKPMTPLDLQMPNTPTLAQTRAPSAPGGGYGGAGLSDLAARYKQAQMNQFGTLDQQRDIVERGSELHGERVDKMATLAELDAARKQRDAEVMAEHQAQVAQKHEAFLARNQQLADEIGAQKIDPSKVLGDKPLGEKLALLLAGIASGAGGQGQAFMGQLNNIVDQGVRAQMANVDNLKAKLSARQNVFGQMMAESGDRKVAEAQTRNLIYEAAKQKLGADADRLGIPEIENNAKMAMNQIEETKQNPLRVQITGEALRTAQAQAAAAAAAQRAAEEKAWSRGMQVAEMGLKQDAQNIERAKLEKADKNEINAETSKLGAALSDPKLAAGRAAVENSKKRLGINEDGSVQLDKNGKPVVDQSEGLPGVGPTADLRDQFARRPSMSNGLALNPLAWAANKAAGLSGDERVSRGDWDKMALAYQVQVTGSGGSEEQMKQIKAAFAGAKTAQEQRAAVAEADAVYRQIESRTKAGVSPEARRTFEDRLNGVAPAMPGSVTVKR